MHYPAVFFPTDRELYKWWGHFMENAGNTDAAVRLYEQANDVFSLVKLFCSQNKLEKVCMIFLQCNELKIYPQLAVCNL